MRLSFGASIAFCAAALAQSSAQAASLPAVKSSPDNPVAECATPGRLMAFLKAENPGAADKFDVIATEYMRNGEELGLRWDIAFFQMMLETNSLRYTGDVKVTQNNFAGLGATGNGARGESFKDVATGVRAHLQHLLMYTGTHVDNPVAERTRNVQDWGVLTDWQKTIKGPMTFVQLAKQWAPGSRGYVTDISAIQDRFMSGACNGPDPHPELVAEARKGLTAKTTDVASAQPVTKPAETKGDALARQALEDARSEGTPRTGLGAGNLAAAAAAGAAAAAKPAAPINILNALSTDATADKPAADAKTDSKMGPPPPAAKPEAKVETAALTTSVPVTPGKSPASNKATGAAAPSPSSSSKTCKVWTASYGGEKAVVIKADAGDTTNYTVLDVNDGTEDKEADAYIAAYAKDGKKIAEFKSQDEALDKAFALCPEG